MQIEEGWWFWAENEFTFSVGAVCLSFFVCFSKSCISFSVQFAPDLHGNQLCGTGNKLS